MKSPIFLLLVIAALASSGCRMARHLPGNWYVAEDRTTYRTPDLRMDAIREIANRSDGTDDERQQRLVQQLATQIQIEPDPLVRRQIVESASEFRVPLANQILLAGLSDDDAMVRLTCCQNLGKRADAGSIDALAERIGNDSDHHVRVAATQALGKIKDPRAAAALVGALSDSDPALQYAGVESMKSITGRDYGSNVETYLQVARGERTTPVEDEETSIALRPRDWFK